MSSKIETQALQIVDALYSATYGRTQQWRSRAQLGGTDDALQHAVDWGWPIVVGGHSVCLTDHGRQRLMR